VNKIDKIDLPYILLNFCLISTFLFPFDAVAREWTRFRGPNGQGISNSTGIPIKWTEEDLNWKTALPGSGHASPVVWQKTIYTTCADIDNNRGYLLAINRKNGAIVWQKAFDFEKYHINRNNSFASSTPAVDEKHVYVLWTTLDKTELLAYAHSGKEVWRAAFGGVHR